MIMAQALVPLKDLVQAKTRLSGLLSPSERRALAQAMVEDVLAVLSVHPWISRVTLVSDDPGASLLAARYRIDYWSEKSLGCRGLNAVVACASQRLLAESGEPLLVLHGDLPLLTATDISTVIQRQRDLGGLVIAPDLQGSGTNLLAFDRGCMPRFCFGADSCARHRRAAQADSLETGLVNRPGIATDVDEVQDLAVLVDTLGVDSTGETAALLWGTDLGSRIRLALDTLGDGARSTIRNKDRAS